MDVFRLEDPLWSRELLCTEYHMDASGTLFHLEVLDHKFQSGFYGYKYLYAFQIDQEKVSLRIDGDEEEEEY